MAGRVLFVMLLASLAGCAPNGQFPSLAMRPEERLVSLGEPVRPRVEAPGDAALRQRAATLLAQGRQGSVQFERDLPAAERALASPGAVGSDSWVGAQQALSRLEAARNETTTALAALDRLATERAEQATNSEDYALILEAKAELERLAAAQQERLDRLRSRLRDS